MASWTGSRPAAQKPTAGMVEVVGSASFSVDMGKALV
jgi:hypothetical protein